MKTNPLKQGAIIVNGEGIGTVTPDMVWKRAAELRMIYGHTSAVVSKEECEQARQELTGDPEVDDIEAAIESAPESVRWDLIHSSSVVQHGSPPAKMSTTTGKAIAPAWWRKGLEKQSMIRCS